MYKPDGVELTKLDNVAAWQKSIENFKRDHPDFLGVKFVFAMGRSQNPTAVSKTMTLFETLKYLYNFYKSKKKTMTILLKFNRSAYPDIIVGADLVGQEDLGRSLVQFKEAIQAHAPTTKYFFHAAETSEWIKYRVPIYKPYKCFSAFQPPSVRK